MYKKHVREKKSHLFTYLRFVLLVGCVFILLVLLVRAKSFRKKIKSLNSPEKLVFLSWKQFSFLNGLHKSINTFMQVSTFIPLWGPSKKLGDIWIQYITLFHFFNFYFFFLRSYKKHKNANKWISYFFPLRCFLSAIFYFC